MKRKVGHASAMLVLIAVASFGLAEVFIRVPVLWPLVPAWLGDGLASAIKGESQEQVVVLEFISVWVLCFGVLVAIWVVAGATRRTR